MDFAQQLQRLGRRRHLPLLFQAEAAECGFISCLMIANFHGHDMDLSAMRRRYSSTSAKGSTLADLIDLGHQLGFNPRPLRVELDYLSQLQLPCVLHWDINHFVVLKEITARQAILHDPARGLVRLSFAELSTHLTGVVLELEPAENFEPIEDHRSISIRAITGRLVGIKRSLVQLLLLSLSLEVFVFVTPFFLQGVIDQVLVSGDRQFLHVLCAGLLAVVLFQGIVTGLRGWVLTWLSARINAQWTTNLFQHLLRLPMAYFERRHTGDVISRFASVETIQRTLTTTFVTTMLDGMTGALLLFLLAAYSLSLTTIVLGAAFTYSVLRWITARHLRNAQSEQIHHSAHQQSSIMESLRGMQTIKLAGAQARRVGRYGNMTIEVAQRTLVIQRIAASFTALDHVVFGAQRVLLILLGASGVLDLKLSAGMLIAYLAYAELFANRSKSFVDKAVELKLLQLQTERVADIALTPPESNAQTAYLGSLPHWSIEVKDLCFRYAVSEPWVIRDCSFRIEPGSSVALVGPSGCGKTTLAKLLLGLLKPQEGTIKIGDVDIRTYGLENYRRLFGTVMQEDQLFAGSITENITFFDPSLDFAQVERSARQAAIHDEILAMPMGYETMVGDMGSALSGGQKQRVLLARALNRQPKYLLLDEATSHLDVFNEERVNTAIRDLQVTRILIAHRPETINSADHVFALARGHVTSCSRTEYLGANKAEGMSRYPHTTTRRTDTHEKERGTREEGRAGHEATGA